jgi:uncharacterized protein (DUF2345 family)
VPTPADSQQPPTSKMIRTVTHTVEFADKAGEEAIKITDKSNNRITLDKNGILIVDAKQNKITTDDSGVKIEDKNSNIVTADSSGVKIEDKNGNVITMASGSVTIKSSSILIGDGASEPLVLGNRLQSALNNWINGTFATHMHTGNLGAPTTPPLPGAPLVLTPALSPTNKVK